MRSTHSIPGNATGKDMDVEVTVQGRASHSTAITQQAHQTETVKQTKQTEQVEHKKGNPNK
jgi:hypothetical protein